ncbi:hypothetical protein LRS06_21085 [Hymenobacter sp. J193]|uniref:hypothetical protein n=1 Tax=Hymenobacter sp. J193 TaxID=2898429 RepID=UPI0021507966|nr:hypothetical protein [Hymenobacter sp. J193]MCR5890224.1 hypothetical protein [Hymenobacter sp. J193]
MSRRFFASALLLAGCSHQAASLPGFEAATWRSDPYACNDTRASQLTVLQKNREALYGVHTDAIDKLLGRPDEVELSAQTEKVYIYYLRPGAQCEAGHPRSQAAKLSLRFDPLGLVSEVLLPVAHQ